MAGIKRGEIRPQLAATRQRGAADATISRPREITAWQAWRPMNITALRNVGVGWREIIPSHRGAAWRRLAISYCGAGETTTARDSRTCSGWPIAESKPVRSHLLPSAQYRGERENNAGGRSARTLGDAGFLRVSDQASRLGINGEIGGIMPASARRAIGKLVEVKPLQPLAHDARRVLLKWHRGGDISTSAASSPVALKPVACGISRDLRDGRLDRAKSYDRNQPGRAA